MTNLTRRSVLSRSLGLAAAGALARPHIANAAATTAELWWVQGFAQEEDVAFKKLVADYEKASGNKIEQSIVPFAPAPSEDGLGDYRRCRSGYHGICRFLVSSTERVGRQPH
jgi:ABC-type glycerol-3-phosphate transport system substrate-binding protein